MQTPEGPGGGGGCWRALVKKQKQVVCHGKRPVNVAEDDLEVGSTKRCFPSGLLPILVASTSTLLSSAQKKGLVSSSVRGCVLPGAGAPTPAGRPAHPPRSWPTHPLSVRHPCLHAVASEPLWHSFAEMPRGRHQRLCLLCCKDPGELPDGPGLSGCIAGDASTVLGDGPGKKSGLVGDGRCSCQWRPGRPQCSHLRVQRPVDSSAAPSSIFLAPQRAR